MALFTESELDCNNALNILDEATYLSESESIYDIKMVPVRENSRIGAAVVNFEDLDRFAESYGVDYITATQALAEENNLDTLAVAVDETDIILNPEIVNELSNVVVRPISENDSVYQFCEQALEKYINTGDESILEAIVVFDEWSKPYKSTDLSWHNLGNDIKDVPGDVWHGIKTDVKGLKKNGIDHIGNTWKAAWKRDKVGTGLFGATAATGGSTLPALVLYSKADHIRHLYHAFKDRPRNVVSRKIASLRALYRRWLARAEREKDLKVSGLLKRACTNIMILIDKLLALLQRAADKFSS